MTPNPATIGPAEVLVRSDPSAPPADPLSLAPLAKALALAQAAMGALHKNGKATVKGQSQGKDYSYDYTYATLAAAWEACRGPLTSNGLAVVQMPRLAADGLVEVETMLLHESGSTLSSTLAARPVKSDPQGIGSAITYLRRYGLLAMVGLAPDDDDGEAASHPADPPKRAPRQAAAPRAAEKAPARPQETPKAQPPPPTPAREHDSSWEADRPGFCADLQRKGVTYDGVCSILERKGKPRPSAWKAQERRRFLEYLATEDGALSYGAPGLTPEEEADLFSGRQPGEDDE